VAVSANGMETEAEVLSLKGSEATMMLLDVEQNKRVQASRRMFEIVKKNDVTVRYTETYQ